MMLANCKHSGNRPPAGSVYIGRAMKNVKASPLANPFAPKSKGSTTAIAVADEKVLEHYRRHLTRCIVQGFRELDELRELSESSTLACWCADRRAEKHHRGEQRSAWCHGDIIYSVWLALAADSFRLKPVDFCASKLAGYEAWGKLYLDAFGDELTWGRGRS